MLNLFCRLVGNVVEGMPWLGTFHAIGAKMLRRHAELVGLQSYFTILDTDDQMRLIKQLISANDLDEKRWPARALLTNFAKMPRFAGEEAAAMATVNISLPDQMKDWVESQAGTGRYGNVSDFVRDLIRREQIRADKIAHMQRLVDEARASGISDETMADIRERALREAARAR